jgi:photosystem II stability/assembly factor-like uncharacterized protein
VFFEGAKMKRFHLMMLFVLTLSIVLFSQGMSAQSAEEIGTLYESFKWRSIGPAVMGGRTVDIDVVEKKPWIIYTAMGPSGVWKTENNGITWVPVFYKEKTVSVGDIAISQSQPNIIWAGTGEATSRNSVTIGDGVYKSLDSGETWQNMGLANTRHISRIVLNPQDPNIVYVAAMGHLWGPNEERGIYKTIDGGKNWKKVLYVDENTGFCDLAMHPQNHQILYAAAWEYRRLPYYFSSGGSGSGLYKSIDGGLTWKKLEKDLPQGVMGRIGISVSRSSPDVIYALIEHEDGGIWRSEDAGETWTRTGDNKTFKMVNNRPFYYSQIRVDPSDDKKIYVFSTGSYVSMNMGKTFRGISGGTHADHHALWIDPKNPLHLIDGNDGGIDFTYDGGKRWHPITHMSVSHVYQIGYDMQTPYYVYCGLQDNGLWGGPSQTYDLAGILNADWFRVGGGDGFYVQVDPTDHTVIYGNYQVNGLYQLDKRIYRSRSIKPLASQMEAPYRFNWNSPIHISPHDPKTIYTGGNYLFKTVDKGHSWEVISLDLTTNDPVKLKTSGGPITLDNSGAELHCTIVTISESPVKQGVIWCGTDDGNVQITQDGGHNWANVVKNIKGLPPNTWCSRIEASHFEEGTAYAAFDGHRHDDYGTYVYKTNDFGLSWTSLKSNLPFGWVHVIREDLINENLLYLGTEFGIFASLDGGDSWFSLKNDLPTVAVRDIAVHPRENDLIIGTHGRGVWILDDISFLQEMSAQVLQEDMFVFSIRSSVFTYRSGIHDVANSPFRGNNPPWGMVITVYLKEKPKDRPKLIIRDENENQVFEINLRKKEGLQRHVWSYIVIPETKDGKAIKSTGMASNFMLNQALGQYTVELKLGDNKIKNNAVVLPDPRLDSSDQFQIQQREKVVESMVMLKKLNLSTSAAGSIRRQIKKLMEDLEKSEEEIPAVREALAQFDTLFSPVEKEVMPDLFGSLSSMDTLLRGGSLAARILLIGSSIGSFPQPPTQGNLVQLAELTEIVEELVKKINQIITNDLSKLNEVLEAYELKPIRAPKEVIF